MRSDGHAFGEITYAYRNQAFQRSCDLESHHLISNQARTLVSRIPGDFGSPSGFRRDSRAPKERDANNFPISGVLESRRPEPEKSFPGSSVGMPSLMLCVVLWTRRNPSFFGALPGLAARSRSCHPGEEDAGGARMAFTRRAAEIDMMIRGSEEISASCFRSGPKSTEVPNAFQEISSVAPRVIHQSRE